MKEQKWMRRERKQNKAKYGMRVDGSSVKLLEELASKPKKKKRKNQRN